MRSGNEMKIFPACSSRQEWVVFTKNLWEWINVAIQYATVRFLFILRCRSRRSGSERP